MAYAQICIPILPIMFVKRYEKQHVGSTGCNNCHFDETFSCIFARVGNVKGKTRGGGKMDGKHINPPFSVKIQTDSNTYFPINDYLCIVFLKSKEMLVVETIDKLHAFLAEARAAGKSVGLVPTMGALHEGHASVVKRSVEENGVTVVSVFVNPTQFNDKGDLERYPRTLEADCSLLEALGTDCVFAPTVEEVYPEPDTRVFDFAPLDKVMEGVYRPGHFNGVAQIVSKLFMYVEPDRAYFGEKDFQQLAIIREMVRQMDFKLEIVGCPIVREADGLALSSRNALLTAEQRVTALAISKALFASVDYAKEHSLEETKQMVEKAIADTEGLELEYYEVVNGDTLQPVAAWDDAGYIVGCITVYCGKVRLIDNIRYK